MDLVIIRENEEDTYSGIEHRQTEDVYQCLKLITRPGCERIVRYAFEYARKFNRKKVTCLSKDNIMKMTDGIFHRVFNEIAPLYPDIETNHLIVDIGTALVACQPEKFDVLVTLNLYGDIISDVAAQVAGSVGLAGSANIGNHAAMFEAIHGSAPDIAGKDIANPSGLLNGAVQMLVHINAPDAANLVENAWLKTLEDGIHTGDIYSAQHSKEKVGTMAFADAVIARLGQKPQYFKVANYQLTPSAPLATQASEKAHSDKKLVGSDIFIDQTNLKDAAAIAETLQNAHPNLQLIVLTSRGLKIWPNSSVDDPYLEHICCRFQSGSEIKQLSSVTAQDIIQLQTEITNRGFNIIKTENLYTFGGQPGFSLAQGQ